VEGNQQVVAEHILGVVGTRVGEPLSREQLQTDVEAIYGLGFFSFVDISLQSVPGGAAVTYVVRENRWWNRSPSPATTSTRTRTF
jgi:outer membrane protein insertion porin family